MAKIVKTKSQSQTDLKAKMHPNSSLIKRILPCGLYLVATPIGNLGDITKRAIEIFKAADLVLAEDTRVTRKLFSLIGADNKIWRADEEATPKAIKAALEVLEGGGAVAFAPDAGSPSISDPGQRLSDAVINAGFEVYAAPGASSVLTALAVSGFDAHQFAFLGFIPPKTGARIEFLRNGALLPLTIIMFETAPRLLASIGAMLEIFGDRRIMVSRELTKLYEEKRRGTAAELYEYYKTNGAPKGEIVIVIERGETKEIELSQTQIEELIKETLKQNSVKDCAAIVSKQTGINRREIYEMALKLK